MPPASQSFEWMANMPATILAYGHTHVPVVSRVGETLIVNPGSVGQGSLIGTERRPTCPILYVIAEEAQLITL